jgi:hypothetical protein
MLVATIHPEIGDRYGRRFLKTNPHITAKSQELNIKVENAS